ncbi:Hypothetical protein NTJ_01445 [Nesidiocoris tenuis]|uniref:Uncharacterized protein n=1 Tax=Nesidiocoris tenuis TaxID=355587 RepID=A0ABN7ABG7_9HEMI|nr:Hypothetical protein NTJ_01445 [Nesidiocoris tenuis]
MSVGLRKGWPRTILREQKPQASPSPAPGAESRQLLRLAVQARRTTCHMSILAADLVHVLQLTRCRRLSSARPRLTLQVHPIAGAANVRCHRARLSFVKFISRCTRH